MTRTGHSAVPSPTRVRGAAALRQLVGVQLGPSVPIVLEQSVIDAFADITGDRNWLHVDPERASRESPYGTTIAHGDLVLALVASLRTTLLELVGFDLMINRGWRDVDYAAPVRAGTELRATSVIELVESSGVGGWEVVERLDVLVGDRIACRGRSVTWLMEKEDARGE
jgi:acyl dehydratase